MASGALASGARPSPRPFAGMRATVTARPRADPPSPGSRGPVSRRADLPPVVSTRGDPAPRPIGRRSTSRRSPGAPPVRSSAPPSRAPQPWWRRSPCASRHPRHEPRGDAPWRRVRRGRRPPRRSFSSHGMLGDGARGPTTRGPDPAGAPGASGRQRSRVPTGPFAGSATAVRPPTAARRAARVAPTPARATAHRHPSRGHPFLRSAP